MRPFLMNVNLRYDSVSEGTLARATHFVHLRDSVRFPWNETRLREKKPPIGAFLNTECPD